MVNNYIDFNRGQLVYGKYFWLIVTHGENYEFEPPISKEDSIIVESDLETQVDGFDRLNHLSAIFEKSSFHDLETATHFYEDAAKDRSFCRDDIRHYAEVSVLAQSIIESRTGVPYSFLKKVLFEEFKKSPCMKCKCELAPTNDEFAIGDFKCVKQSYPCPYSAGTDYSKK